MDMIYPSIGELTKGNVNRYALVIATAKCARAITNEYVRQRERAERLIANKDTDKSLMISKEFREDKAVRTAINRIYDGEYQIIVDGEDEDASADADAAPAASEEAKTEEN